MENFKEFVGQKGLNLSVVKLFRMSRSSANTNNDPSHHKQFQDAIKKWEEVRNDPAHNDPTEVVCELADILEKVSRFTDHIFQLPSKVLYLLF